MQRTVARSLVSSLDPISRPARRRRCRELSLKGAVSAAQDAQQCCPPGLCHAFGTGMEIITK